MQRHIITLLVTFLLSFSLIGCATKSSLELKSGAYHFEKGYYKRAMRELLPPATNGNPRAQYAVGYMYYYGYGVNQDTDIGYFWIQKAARCNDPKAIEALGLMSAERERPKRTYTRFLK